MTHEQPSRSQWRSGRSWRLPICMVVHCNRMPEMIDGVPPLPVPQACPVTLDELLASPPEAA